MIILKFVRSITAVLNLWSRSIRRLFLQGLNKSHFPICFLCSLFLCFLSGVSFADPLPTSLQSALEKIDTLESGPSEERVFRRYVNDQNEDLKLVARVGMAQSQRQRGQAREALAWVQEYATVSPENVQWPRIQGLVESTRVRVALGQTYDAVSNLNRALKDCEEGLARIEVLRALSEVVEIQPDLEKALAFEKDALAHGNQWFKRIKKVDTDAKGYQPPKTGDPQWKILKPKIEARISDLEFRIRVDLYGLDFVLYELAQLQRRADHPNALDFTDVAAAFRVKDTEGRSRIPEADFEAARTNYLEIIEQFPEGIYTEAAKLYAAVCLAHLGETRKALRELISFYQEDPSGLYRGEALKVMGDLYLFGNWDKQNAKEAYLRSARWCETVANQSRVLETYLVPEASKEISKPPESLRSLSQYGVLQKQSPPSRSLINRVTADWYLEGLRAEVEGNLAFLAFVAGDAESVKLHLDLVLAHDKLLQRQVNNDTFNAYARILQRVEKGKPLVGEVEELRGLREKEALLMQWADMQFMLENFDRAQDLYQRIQSLAEQTDNENALARALVAENLLQRATQDDKRFDRIPRLLDVAIKYPRSPSSPHLLYRAALLSEGDPPPAELFAMIYRNYPQSPYAIRARYDEILRTIPWKANSQRREAIDQFKLDFPDRSNYHDYLERFDRQVLSISN